VVIQTDISNSKILGHAHCISIVKPVWKIGLGVTPVAVSERAKEIMESVNSQMGKGTIKSGSDPYFVVEYLPTGISAVDDLLQGGIPYGRFVEIFGNYSTLKSFVGLKAIASCQQRGGLAALIDTEHSFDPKWAKECGVDIENLVLKRPKNAEEAVDISEVLIRGGVDLIVFDSVAAALPKAEQELMLSGDKNIQPARLAALMSIAMRKLTTANRKTAMIWINQTRVNVGMMFGNPETTTGGTALPFYASMRIALRKAGQVNEKVTATIMKDGKPTKVALNLTVAQTIKATVEKSKLNAPHREIQFNFNFRTGQIDEWLYLVTKALDANLIEYNRGVWCLNKKGAKKYRGREAFQKDVGESELRILLGLEEPSGTNLVDPWKEGSRNGKSSKRVVRKSIQTQGRAKSKTTARIVKRSTKSRTR
jgi:recombination protein RecA